MSKGRRNLAIVVFAGFGLVLGGVIMMIFHWLPILGLALFGVGLLLLSWLWGVISPAK